MNDNYLLGRILVIPAILVAFTFKGYIQSKIAIKLGDDTPKQYGRNTLNPLKHISVFGFIFMLIIGFGWIKPVEINKSNFKDYYKADLKIRLGGLITTLVIGFIATITLALYVKFIPGNSSIKFIIYLIIKQTAIINCSWFILNLLPIPGFDGFNIILDILRGRSKKFETLMYRNNMLIFIILVLPIIGGFSILDFVVGIPGKYIYDIFATMATYLFL
ncbi:site-2 protease family protein [uncultured Clostridium sp.]|uniref:site-2 protease family protein n=1 Tax=uncultured Clostridium sp. TaxID=59620 RepID=UPI0032170C29